MIKNRIAILTVIVFVFLNYARAEDKNSAAKKNTVENTMPSSAAGQDLDFLQSLDYPELQVVPRASERVQLETKYEKENGWTMFWPIQVSALTSIGTGIASKGRYIDSSSSERKADLDLAAVSAAGIGVAWLGLSVYLDYQQFYMSEYSKINNIKGKDRRSELLRERMSEESLERPARLMKIITWASVISNLAANAYVSSRVNYADAYYSYIGMISSFLPLVFQSRYIENYEKQLEYKRKIYAPVAYFDLFHPSMSNTGSYVLQPQMVVAWKF